MRKFVTERVAAVFVAAWLLTLMRTDDVGILDCDVSDFIVDAHGEDSFEGVAYRVLLDVIQTVVGNFCASMTLQFLAAFRVVLQRRMYHR